MGNPENVPANVDPALLDLFRAEMDAHVPVLSAGLLDLEKGRAGEQEIAAMMRAAHSIKGAARIVGIEAAVRLAHVMEDCFTAAKETRIRLTSEAVDVLLQGVDVLQRICSMQPDPELNEKSLASLQERIAAVKDGRTPTPVAEQPPAPSGPHKAASLSVPAPKSAEQRLTLPEDLNDTAADELGRQIREAISQGAPRIRLDFTNVKRLGAAALALFVSFVHEVARMEPAPVVTVIGIAGPVAALLRVAGLNNIWTAEN